MTVACTSSKGLQRGVNSFSPQLVFTPDQNQISTQTDLDFDAKNTTCLIVLCRTYTRNMAINKLGVDCVFVLVATGVKGILVWGIKIGRTLHSVFCASI